jgi:hypothetical protein
MIEGVSRSDKRALEIAAAGGHNIIRLYMVIIMINMARGIKGILAQPL